MQREKPPAADQQSGALVQRPALWLLLMRLPLRIRLQQVPLVRCIPLLPLFLLLV